VLFTGSLLLLAGFVAQSRRARSPILDLRLFDNEVFRRANASAFFFGASFMSVVIFLPLFLVNVLDVSATRAGVALIPFSMGLVFGSTLAGQAVSRFGHLRDQILAGGVVMLLAAVLLSRMDADTGYWTVMSYMVLAGLGLGPSLPLFTLAIQNAVDVRRVGQATSAAQFFRQIGGTVGAAIMGTVLGTTLGISFASLELPTSVAEGADTSIERLASTGGGELPDRIRAGYARLSRELAAVVEEGDVRGTQALIASSGLDAQVRRDLAGAVGALPVMTAAERAAVSRELRELLDGLGGVEAVRVSNEVKDAFVRATSRVYTLTAWILVVALALAVRIPERPLRKTHDRAELREDPPPQSSTGR
jgi:MFS family permease